MPYLARHLTVGNFLEAAPGGVGEHYDLLRKSLAAGRTPLRLLSSGDSIMLGSGVQLQVLSPRLSPQRSGVSADDMSLNEESLVFRLTYGMFSMLFTADAGFPAEDGIMAQTTDIRSTVLKVGHHGSRYSSSERFLRKVAPHVALISAGDGNSFGLPSAATLNLLNQLGIRTYRTDRDGTIELVSDGTSWSVSTPYRNN